MHNHVVPEKILPKTEFYLSYPLFILLFMILYLTWACRSIGIIFLVGVKLLLNPGTCLCKVRRKDILKRRVAMS